MLSFNEDVPMAAQTGKLTDEQSNRFDLGIRETIEAQQDPVPDSSRLDKNDAKFVTVIHTNAFGFGIYENVGDVDFWPNGGILAGFINTSRSIFISDNLMDFFLDNGDRWLRSDFHKMIYVKNVGC